MCFSSEGLTRHLKGTLDFQKLGALISHSHFSTTVRSDLCFEILVSILTLQDAFFISLMKYLNPGLIFPAGYRRLFQKISLYDCTQNCIVNASVCPPVRLLTYSSLYSHFLARYVHCC